MDPFAQPEAAMAEGGEGAPEPDITGEERVTLRALYQRARDHADDELGPKLERAFRYYDGQIDAQPAFYVGRDEAGREVFHGSRTVVRECRDKLRAAMPELARVFLSSDELVAFTPKGREDEEYAQQATDYCNYIARSQGGEERILDAFFDWGIKFAAIKVYWHVETIQEVKGFSGVTEMALQMLQQSAQNPDTDVQEVEAEPYEEMMPDGMPVVLYRGKTKVKRKNSSLKWELIPQDEFIIDPDAMSEASALMIGQDCYRTVSDVVAMGIPWEMVRQHSGHMRPQDNDDVAVARRGRSNKLTATDVPDDSLQYVRFIETIVRMDRDGDGIAERYRAVMLGDGPEPIALEPGDDCFYIVSSPYRRPHEPIGTGIVEEGTDLQDQLTALVRGWINSANRANHPRETVSDRDTSAYEALKSPFGGPIRTTDPQGVGVHVIPFTGDQNLPLIQYFEARSAARFGISPAGQGLDPDVLKGQTVTAAKAIVSAPQVALEFLCREFAAGVMRPMFKAMVAIAKRYQDKATVIRLRGQWVEVDPSDWPAEMDVDVRVGLGGGTKQEKFVGLMAIMAKQQELKAQGSPLVTAEGEAEALKAFVELQGYKNTGRFFLDVSGEELQQMMAQAAEQQKQQAKEAAMFAAEAEAMKAAAVQRERSVAEVEKAKIDAALAQAKTDTDANLQMEKAVMEMTIQRERIASEERLARERLAIEAALKREELAMERELETMKMRNQSAGGQGDLRGVAN